jgi:uncharacterized membrane protein
MRIDDISILGGLHSAACVVALFAGPLIFTLRKGTPRHRLMGTWYAGAMVIANITALGLFAPIQGLPTFNMFHWMAVATLVMIGLGVWAARHQGRVLGAYSHPIMMILSFYMLVGGGINEAFSRIDALRAMAFGGSPAAHNIAQTRMAGAAQGMAMLIALVMIIWSAISVARRRGRRRAPALVAAE